MITHILLDWDGTIVDSEPLSYEANRLIFEQLGIKLSVDEYVRRWIQEGTYTLGMIKDYGIRKSLQEIRQLRRKIYMELCKGLKLQKGVMKFLSRHQHLHPLPIVTTSGRRLVEPLIEGMGLWGKVEVLVAGEESKAKKPDPHPYMKAASLLGTEPQHCLAFEDSIAGVKAAKAAGMICIAIPTQYTDKRMLKDADAVVNSFEDVTPELMHKLGFVNIQRAHFK